MQIDKLISIADFVCEGRISWFWEDRNKALFCIDMETYMIDCVSVCPFTEMYCEQMFKAITKVNEHIILASRRGKAIIADYNCATDEWKLIDVSKYAIEKNWNIGEFNFNMCVPYENGVYIMGHMMPVIIYVNLSTYEVLYLCDWIEGICGMLPEKKICYLTRGAIKDDKVFLPLGCSNDIVILNMRAMTVEVIKIECSQKAFNQCEIVGDELWIVGGYEPVIVIYSLERRDVEEIKLEEDANERWAPYYMPIFTVHGALMIPLWAGNTYYVDIVTKQLSVCSELNKYSCISVNYFLMKIIYANEKIVFFYYIKEHLLKIYNIEQNCFVDFDFGLSDKTICYLCKKYLEKKVCENIDFSLVEYIKMIKSS